MGGNRKRRFEMSAFIVGPLLSIHQVGWLEISMSEIVAKAGRVMQVTGASDRLYGSSMYD